MVSWPLRYNMVPDFIISPVHFPEPLKYKTLKLD